MEEREGAVVDEEGPVVGEEIRELADGRTIRFFSWEPLREDG